MSLGKFCLEGSPSSSLKIGTASKKTKAGGSIVGCPLGVKESRSTKASRTKLGLGECVGFRYSERSKEGRSGEGLTWTKAWKQNSHVLCRKRERDWLKHTCCVEPDENPILNAIWWEESSRSIFVFYYWNLTPSIPDGNGHIWLRRDF